jgi:hypothetical protein
MGRSALICGNLSQYDKLPHMEELLQARMPALRTEGKTALRASHQEAPETQPYPILRRMSRLRFALLRAVPGPAAAGWGHRHGRVRAAAAGRGRWQSRGAF